MMNMADIAVPAAIQPGRGRCTPRGSTFQPKTQTPRNVDSRKNAARPSIASGAPNTSPTNFVRRPVHAELELLHQAGDDADRDAEQQQPPKNFVSRRYSGSRVRYHCVCRIATSGLRPDRDRHEQEVVDARHGELGARQVELRQVHVGGPPRETGAGQPSGVPILPPRPGDARRVGRSGTGCGSTDPARGRRASAPGCPWWSVDARGGRPS